MRKIFLIALIPVTFFAVSCKTAHGGNCNCPKFGKSEKKQVSQEHMASSEKKSDLQ